MSGPQGQAGRCPARQQADSVIDERLDRLHEVVAAKQAGHPQLSELVEEAEAVGEVSDLTRARSTVAVAPFVATLMPSTPRASSPATGTFAAGQVYVSTFETLRPHTARGHRRRHAAAVPSLRLPGSPSPRTSAPRVGGCARRVEIIEHYNEPDMVSFNCLDPHGQDRGVLGARCGSAEPILSGRIR